MPEWLETTLQVVGVAVLFAATIFLSVVTNGASNVILSGVWRGGISAYATGNNFWEGAGKGAVNNLIEFGSAALVAVGIYLGWNTNIGSTMIALGSSMMLNSLELMVIQSKKSIHDGDGFWEAMYDVENARFANAGKILLGTEEYGPLVLWGSNIKTIHDAFSRYHSELIVLSQSMKTSRAASILAEEILLAKKGFLPLIGTYASLLVPIYNLGKAIFEPPDYENSGWILY